MADLFNEHGNLEIGFHEWTLEQFYQALVLDFPESKTRRDIATGFSRFLIELIGVLGVFEIWVDGSYTTTKLDPNDVDTVTVLDGVWYTEQLPASERRKLFGKFEGEVTAEEYKVDSYLLVVYPDDHLAYASYIKEYNTRTRDFTFDDRTNLQKGIIRLKIKPDDIALLQTWQTEGGEG